MVDFKKLAAEPLEERRRRRAEADRAVEEKIRRLRQMIEELALPAKPLTAWEERFVESVDSYLRTHEYLTDRQTATLEKIHKERKGH